MYLLGVNLPDKKLVRIALTYIYGIGRTSGEQICHKLEIHPQCRLFELNEQKVTLLTKHLNSLKIEQELKRYVRSRIEHLVNIKSFKGQRHLEGLPVKGQRTKNSSTAKKLNGSFLRATRK